MKLVLTTLHFNACLIRSLKQQTFMVSMPIISSSFMRKSYSEFDFFRFGSRSPETGRIVQTSYSAGPRGFRARGPDIARQTDLSQIRLPYSPPVPTDSSNYDPAYDRYHDPNEDPSYKFTVRTPSQSKSETADSKGHVEGVYSYLDDVGERILKLIAKYIKIIYLCIYSYYFCGDTRK